MVAAIDAAKGCCWKLSHTGIDMLPFLTYKVQIGMRPAFSNLWSELTYIRKKHPDLRFY